MIVEVTPTQLIESSRPRLQPVFSWMVGTEFQLITTDEAQKEGNCCQGHSLVKQQVNRQAGVTSHMDADHLATLMNVASCWTSLSRTGKGVCFPYLGCCWLTDDHPSWTLLVTVMWDRDIGSPLIEEAFGSVNATVFDAGHLLKFLAYSITIVEIAPARFICQEKVGKRNHKGLATHVGNLVARTW